MKLRVCALYPELMNIYADRGNLLLLQKRCEWRGIGFELAGATIRDKIDPRAHDLFYMGGGQDRDQALCARDMVETKKDPLHAAADEGKVMLAVCGGYQLLGQEYRMDDQTLPGVGLFTMTTSTEPGAPRLIGNCAIEVDLGGYRHTLAGFENHGGRTHRDARQAPLGTVLKGHGNDGRDGTEGCRRNNVFGTYLHGPLLPKNAWFADHLIELALATELAPLDDRLEELAHASACRAAGL
jgi:CobQ-like glutamine amidotransferase family enzyme